MGENYVVFLKPILRKKKGECPERASSSLLCSVVSISHVLLSLHELYKAPHWCSLSPTFILFDLFLKRQICCWMSHTYSGLHSGCCSLWYRHMEWGIQGKWQQDSLRNGDLILSKICCGHCLWNERKTALEGSAASFVLYLSTFSWVAMHVQLVFYLVWVLFSTLRKAVMLIAQCMTESLKSSKVKQRMVITLCLHGLLS